MHRYDASLGSSRGGPRRPGPLALVRIAAALTVVYLLAPGPVEARAGQRRRVLIVNSYHEGFQWTDDQVAGARNVLAAAIDDLELYVEYMDTKRIVYEGQYRDLLSRTLRFKYKGVKLDAIIATDDNALQLVMTLHEDVFAQVPVVFCGINSYDPSLLVGRKHFTGLIEVLDIMPTIDLALKLHPRTRKVVVVVDDTPTGMAQRRDVAAVAARYKDLQFEYLKGEDLTHAELLGKLAKLDSDAIVLLTVWLRDKTGAFLAPETEGPRISESSPVPVYGIIDMYLGHGIVGGKVLNSRTHGRIAAEMVVRILRGEKPADIPVVIESVNPYMFDCRQLDRWGIDEDDLPEGSTFLNRSFSFYEEYRALIWQVISAFAVLVLGLLVLGANIIRRKRAQEDLRKSEEQFRRFAEASSYGFGMGELSGTVIFANAALLRIVGEESQETFLGKSFFQYYRPDDAERLRQEILPSVLDKGQWVGEVPILSARGNLIATEQNIFLIRDEKGTPRMVGNILTDITERKRAQGALRESEAKFTTAFRAAPTLMLITRLKDGHIIDVNHAFARVFGYHRDELLGRKTIELDLWERVEQRAMFTEEIKKYGKADSLEVTVRTKTGQVRWMLLSGEAVDLGGERCLITVANDITDRKRAEEQRLGLERQVQHAQKLESVGVLAGGIAHDFNNILTVILGNADLAMYDLSPRAPAREYIREVLKASRRAAELAKQMLAYSGKGRFVVEPIDLGQLVSEMAHLLEVSISKKVTLTYNFADDLPAIDGDATQVRQVVMNLITNASEAIGNKNGAIALSTGVVECDRAYLDGVDETLRAGLDEPLPEGLYVCLEVADTGCGMDGETIAKVFDPFFTTKFTGRGLGMAAVLGIVRGHQGAVKIYSESGKGTTFKILMPANDSPDRGAGSPKRDMGDAEAWHGRGTVLIADDEESVRAVGHRMLNTMGFDVLAASDGREAVETFATHADEIVCVLLDLTMPHMDGEEAFGELTRIRPDVAVILCSGYNQQEATRRFAGKGLAGFVQKPYSLAKLRETLMHVLTDDKSPE